jgi:predicted DNA-binding transcriptional regulator YafY
MRRTDRLFEILRLFGSGRLWVGRDLAERLGVSLRTVYRDIDTLVASGVPIAGERGVGYLLREPIYLPPLALTGEEFQALLLGAEVVRQAGDAAAAAAAGRLLEKVRAASPSGLRDAPLDDVAVLAWRVAPPTPHLGALRRAAAKRRVVEIEYRSLAGDHTTRRVRPLKLAYWGRVWTCPAWCELRGGFRTFRVDLVEACEETGESFGDEAGLTYADFLDYVVSEEARTASPREGRL